MDLSRTLLFTLVFAFVASVAPGDDNPPLASEQSAVVNEAKISNEDLAVQEMSSSSRRHAVLIMPVDIPSEFFWRKTYTFPRSAMTGTSGLFKGGTAKAWLEGNGIVFPQGATVQYLPALERLFVRLPLDHRKSP
ncbi:MAG: hypothetical protein WCP06_07195 [Verrucomicrobiota bacterium]